MLHPVAWAGWAGLLVTALNLIPAGQLDGGHVIYVLMGKRATSLLPFILLAMVLLGFFWAGWWLWALLIFMLGRFHAEPLDQITALDPPRQALAVAGLVIFILQNRSFRPLLLIIFVFPISKRNCRISGWNTTIRAMTPTLINCPRISVSNVIWKAFTIFQIR